MLAPLAFLPAIVQRLSSNATFLGAIQGEQSAEISHKWNAFLSELESSLLQLEKREHLLERMGIPLEPPIRSQRRETARSQRREAARITARATSGISICKYCETCHRGKCCKHRRDIVKGRRNKGKQKEAARHLKDYF